MSISRSWDEEKDRIGKEIISMLYEQGMIKTWYRDNPDGWRLVSGLWSPFYIQLRPLSSYSNSKVLLTKVGDAMASLISHEAPDVNKLVGVVAAGIPIAIATTIFSGIPSCYTRKLPDEITVTDIQRRMLTYGEHSLVEGELNDGDVIAIVDDLVTKFDSKLVALEQIRQEIRRRELEGKRPLSVKIEHVIVLFDREQGAADTAAAHGLKLHSLIAFRSKGVDWLKDKMSKEEYDVILSYLSDSSKYQVPEIQADLAKRARKK
jgi:orotate phosphoribosyltransferase